MPPRLHPSFALVVVIGLSLLGGCAQTVPQLAAESAAQSAEPATREVLEALNDEHGRRQIRELAESPGVQAAAHELGAGIAIGMGEFATARLNPAAIERLARQYVGALAPVVAEAMERNLTPQLRAAFAGAVEDAIVRAKRVIDADEVEYFARRLTRSVVATMVDVLAVGLREDIGPAVEAVIRENIGKAVGVVIREDVGPAIADVMRDEEFKKAMGSNARVMGENFAIGMQRGLRQGADGEGSGYGLLSPVQETLARGQQTARTMLWVLGTAVAVLLLLIVGLALWLRRSLAHTTEITQENERREETMLLLVEALRNAGEDEETAALLQRIAGSPGEPLPDRLDDVLRAVCNSAGSDES